MASDPPNDLAHAASSASGAPAVLRNAPGCPGRARQRSVAGGRLRAITRLRARFAAAIHHGPACGQVLVAACLVLACATADAAVRMHAASLTLPGVVLEDLQVNAMPGPDGRPRLELQAARVSVPSLGWRDVAMTLHGEPRTAGGSAWKFVGHVQARHAPGGALADAALVVVYDPDAGTLAVDIAQGNGSLRALMPLDQPTHLQVTLARLPLAWLRGVLAAAWPQGRVKGGSASGDVALDIATDRVRVSGRVKLAGVDLDSKASTIAAQALAAEGSFRIDHGATSSKVMFDGVVRGGQVLLGPLYARLPTHAANLHVVAALGPAGIAIDSLDYDDHDAMRLSGSLRFGRDDQLEDLSLERFAANLPTAYTRYGTALFDALTGFADVGSSGSVSGSLKIGASGITAFDVTAQGVALDTHGHGIKVIGLDGRVAWRVRGSSPATTLGWKSLDLYRIPFGPAELKFRNDDGALQLRKPANVAVLGGTFDLIRFAWRPDAGASRRLDAVFAVTDVDMSALSRAFGWPAFGGTLAGAVPDLSYRGDALVFDGGLSLGVFGGSVSVTRLSMRHPFGPVPELEADIDLQQLDLAELTGVFDFGKITGRLDGHVGDLHLVDWKPVSFGANLAANGGGKLSQHAINSLTTVGGAGIAGGLQGMALRLFKTFGYARIGLSCTLAGGVCTMSGINPDPAPQRDGYTIVEGSGLPRITVIGHQRKVDWATLVSRVHAATAGNGPVVR